MSIILSESHRQTGEVEFGRKHPDIFSSHLAAGIVNSLAIASYQNGFLQEFRADLNLQASTVKGDCEKITPIMINVAGQVVLPGAIDLDAIIRQNAVDLLEQAGYFQTQDFSPSLLTVNSQGITLQSPNLNATTNSNKFADGCVVYGHYIAPPFGLNGTFPSLAIAQLIDQSLDRALKQGKVTGLRPDGKVHVTIAYNKSGFTLDDVYISVAHRKGEQAYFRARVLQWLALDSGVGGLERATHINEGGNFDVYFLQADSGISKAKDDVIITGGIHQLGTDRVWGKCLYKASSTLVPYAFALSRAICAVTGAGYSSVSAYARYGREEAELQLHEIDPAFEGERKRLNLALSGLPRDRNGIREIMTLPVTLESYALFNDVSGFHKAEKPWKKSNKKLESHIKEALR